MIIVFDWYIYFSRWILRYIHILVSQVLYKTSWLISWVKCGKIEALQWRLHDPGHLRGLRVQLHHSWSWQKEWLLKIVYGFDCDWIRYSLNIALCEFHAKFQGCTTTLSRGQCSCLLHFLGTKVTTIRGHQKGLFQCTVQRMRIYVLHIAC